MEQFNLETWLQDKSRKVVTRDGRVVRIVFTEAQDDNYPILALVQRKTETQKEQPHLFSTHGVYEVGRESCLDLFFADEKKALTEFEKAIRNILVRYISNIDDFPETIIREAKSLLDLARKELEKEYRIVDKDDSNWEDGYKQCKRDALKDLPKWKKATEHKEFDKHVCVMDHYMFPFLDTVVDEGDYYIELSDLKNLPRE